MPDDVTLASTTATQEELNEAMGITSEGEKPETEAESETADTPQEKEQPQHKGRAEKRISELTKIRYRQAEELEDLRRENERLRAGAPKITAAESETSAPKSEVRTKPRSTDPKYKTWEEYNEDLIKWTTEDMLAKKKQIEAQESQNEQLRRNFEQFNKQIVAASEAHEDWDEVVESAKSQEIPKVVELAAVEMDNGAEVLYYLAKNEDFREHLLELNQQSQLKVVQELGRLSDWLESQSEGDKPEKDEKEEKEPVEDKKTPAFVSTAPAPIKPVGSSNTRATSKSLSEITDFQEWKARRQAARRR